MRQLTGSARLTGSEYGRLSQLRHGVKLEREINEKNEIKPSGVLFGPDVCRSDRSAANV